MLPASRGAVNRAPHFVPRKPIVINPDEAFDAALDYRDQGFCVIPGIPGQKRPRCHEHRLWTRLPTPKEIILWWNRWPKTDVLCVLGPVSNLFAIQVRGVDGHQALVDLLGGKEPLAPQMVLTDGRPHHFTLLFKHPKLTTESSMKSWHPQVMLLGRNALLPLPPSKHFSGRHFRWARGRSLEDVTPPKMPTALRRKIEQAALGSQSTLPSAADWERERDYQREMENQTRVGLSAGEWERERDYQREFENQTRIG